MYMALTNLTDITTRYTLYHRNSKGGIKEWSVVGQKSDEGQFVVTRIWGQHGGKLQESPDPMTPRGVENTKSYRSPEQVMHDTIIRHLQKQLEEGYVANIDDVRDEVALSGQDMDFLTIPKNFCPQKPHADKDEDELRKWMSKRNCVIQLKRNGQRVFLLVTPTGEYKAYSRKLEDLTDHLKPWLDEMKRLNILAPSTILDGELLLFPLYHLHLVGQNEDGEQMTIRRGLVVSPVEDFKLLGGITRSSAERAVTMYGNFDDLCEDAVPSLLAYMPFDVLYSKGEPAFDLPYAERRDYIKALAERIDGAVGMKDNWWTIMEPFEFASLDAGIEFVRASKERGKGKSYEGVVVWDNDAPGIVTMNGKPKRNGCVKWKPIHEADVVATGYEEGKGKRQGQAGALNISIRKADGTLKPAGNCGSGITDELSAEIPTWTFPCVVEIEYADQDEESDKFQFPVLVRKRDDKSIDEATVFA